MFTVGLLTNQSHENDRRVQGILMQNSSLIYQKTVDEREIMFGLGRGGGAVRALWKYINSSTIRLFHQIPVIGIDVCQGFNVCWDSCNKKYFL